MEGKPRPLGAAMAANKVVGNLPEGSGRDLHGSGLLYDSKGYVGASGLQYLSEYYHLMYCVSKYPL